MAALCTDWMVKNLHNKVIYHFGRTAAGTQNSIGAASVSIPGTASATSDPYDPLFPFIQDDIFAARCIKDLTNLRHMYGELLPT